MGAREQGLPEMRDFYLTYRTNTVKKTPHQRICDAAKKGAGVRLTADEVAQLADDEAIRARAEMDDMNEAGTPDSDIV